jgi:predicted ATPase
MSAPRLTELRIEGMRCIDRIRLPLDGLSVLIGANGSGKSTIVEACQLLSCAARPSFLEAFNQVHGGIHGLRREDASRLLLGASIDDGGTPLEYALAVSRQGQYASIELEEAWMGAGPKRHALLERAGERVGFFDPAGGLEIHRGKAEIAAAQTALGSLGESATPALHTIARLLRTISVHLPFDTMPYWASRERRRMSEMREPVVLEPAAELTRYGTNLANAFHALRNESPNWQETLDYVRLGLGEEVDDIGTRADAGGGRHAITVKFRGRTPVPAIALSDGQLAYLAHVALFRLSGSVSLLAFDEPELHLHPGLLMRVLGFFESMAQERPVVLATHSDRLLDGLRQPERSAVLCDLDERGATRLLRPDAEKLRRWLEKFTMSDMRSGGHESSLFVVEESPRG